MNPKAFDEQYLLELMLLLAQWRIFATKRTREANMYYHGLESLKMHRVLGFWWSGGH